MVSEILAALTPRPGEIAVDCTLGYGGHAEVILPLIQPGGKLVGLDADPIELPKAERRLRDLGFGPERFTAWQSNFAGLQKVLNGSGISGADVILADLGVSSMQIDDPSRGFSLKHEGPLDMRMNPGRGQPASAFLEKARSEELATWLAENGDEPYASALGQSLAGRLFRTTTELAAAVRATLPRLNPTDRELSVRRVFQALRIEVNDEFSALETFLRYLPDCLNPGGRVAILTFHSGEDRRVKKAFQAARRAGIFGVIAEEVIRPSPEERVANPRSSSAKLRWAHRGEIL